MTFNERWRPIKGYEGSYEVSDTGRVRSLPRMAPFKDGQRRVNGGHLRPLKHPGGYLRVCLWREGRYQSVFIHTLVLEAFSCPRPEGAQAAHEDGNPKNNRLENLRWATPSENQEDREHHGTGRIGKKRSIRRLNGSVAAEIRAHHAVPGTSVASIARDLGLPRTTVADVVNGRTWK